MNAPEMTVLPSGDLRISVDEETREDLANMRPHYSCEYCLWLLLEPEWTNGGYEPFGYGDDNPSLGLTCAPAIAEHMYTDANGRRHLDGRIWWFPEYESQDEIEELITRGHVIFTEVRS